MQEPDGAIELPMTPPQTAECSKEWHTPVLTIRTAASARFSTFPGPDFSSSS